MCCHGNMRAQAGKLTLSLATPLPDIALIGQSKETHEKVVKTSSSANATVRFSVNLNELSETFLSSSIRLGSLATKCSAFATQADRPKLLQF